MKSIDLVVAHQIVVFSFTRFSIHIKSATLLELCFPKKLSERKLLNEEKLFSRNLKMRPSLKILKQNFQKVSWLVFWLKYVRTLTGFSKIVSCTPPQRENEPKCKMVDHFLELEI